MRKHDIFGKKISQIRIVYLLGVVFLLVLLTRFAVITIQSNQLELLKDQESVLQTQINNTLSSNQVNTYHSVSEIIQYLPNSYEQFSIIYELNLIKNRSGLSNATNYVYDIEDDVESPFDENLASTITFVKIEVSMRISTPELLLDYLDALLNADRFYYLTNLSVTYTGGGSAVVDVEMYTFYNDIILN